MTFKLEDFITCLLSGIAYLPNTLLLTFLPVAIAFVLGTAIAVVRYYKVPAISQVLAVVVSVWSAVPLMVAVVIIQLVFTYTFNDLAAAWGLDVTVATFDKIWLGVLALALFDTCYMSESMRGVLNSIPKVQFEAGASIGLSTPRTLTRIIVPQALPKAVPVIIGNICGVLKGSALVFVMGVMEVYNGSILPCATTFHYLEGYLAAAVIYWALSLVIEGAGTLIESHGRIYQKG